MAKKSVLGSDPFTRSEAPAVAEPKAERLLAGGARPRAKDARAKKKTKKDEPTAAAPAAVEPAATESDSTEPAPAAPRVQRRSPAREAEDEVNRAVEEFEARLHKAILKAGGEERLRELEGELTHTLDGFEARLRQALETRGRPADLVREELSGAGRRSLAGRILSIRYYLDVLNRYQLRNRSDEVDEFGMDKRYEEATLPLFEYLYRRYFRVEADGFEHVPNTGPALIVANHSGVFPYDAAMIKMAVRLEHPSNRVVRPLIEDFAMFLPYVGAFITRVGGVRACQENAQRLIEEGYLAAVFPEGIKGNVKYYRQRYQLQRFGRGGFIKLCMVTGAPLIPVAVIGAEEIHPVLARADWLGKLLGLGAFPITPTLPLLGPLGLVPLPSKWRIQFGEPIDLGAYGPEGAEDEILVNRLTLRVRAVIQEMIKDNLKLRRSPYFG